MSSRESQSRIEAVDALRGIAALIVVIYHARCGLWIGIGELYRQYGLKPSFEVLLGYLTAPFSLGWTGVVLFFVLSGYCIHRRGALLLANTPDAPFNFMVFFKRRFFRIYPTYVAALLLTGFVGWHLSSNTSLSFPLKADHSFPTFIASLLSLQGYVAPCFGGNVVFWTLAMEIHLYLAYPLLFKISKLYGPNSVLWFAFVVSISFISIDFLFGIQKSFEYRSSMGPVFLPYLFAWTVGFYISEVEAGRAFLPSQKFRRWLTVISLFFGLALVSLKYSEQSSIFWAIVFGSVLTWSLTPAGRVFWGSFFGKSMTYIGVFSYSLYAIHSPMLMLFKAYANPNGLYISLAPIIASVFFALISAYVFFILIERWSLRTQRSTS